MIINRYRYNKSVTVDTENDYFNVLLPLKDISEYYSTLDNKWKAMCLLWNQDEEGYNKVNPTKVIGTMTGDLLNTENSQAVEVSKTGVI